MAGLKGRQPDSSLTASAFILLPYIALVECFREGNLALHRWVVGKGRGIIITFLDKWGYSSLILHWTSASGNFLKVSFKVKSDTISVNFFVIMLKSNGSYVKIQWIMLYFERILYLWIIFVTSTYWSSGKYWFIELCSYSTCCHISLYSIWKPHLLVSFLRLMITYKFSKILIFTKNFKFYQWRKYCVCMCFKWQAYFYSFCINCQTSKCE